jgi:hypothetical protein
MGADIKPLLCGRRLEKLRRQVWFDAALNFGIGGLPILIFMIISANEVDSFLDTYTPLDCAEAESFASRWACFLRNGAWQLLLPILKTIAYPLESSYAFLRPEPILGISRYTILLVALVVGVAGVVSSSIYTNYRAQSLHFRYVLRSRKEMDKGDKTRGSATTATRDDDQVCISEMINGDDEAKGIDCNPGLASTKTSHVRAVLNMLKKFVKGEKCRKGSNDTFDLANVKAHVTIVAARMIKRMQTWTFVYRCMAIAIAVSAGVVTIQALATMASQVITQKGHLGTRSVCIAFVSFAMAILILIAATIVIALRRYQQKENVIGKGFSNLHAKVDACKSNDETCRVAIESELGQGALIFGQEVTTLDNASQFSPRLLAATVAIASIVVMVAVTFKMGSFSTSRGIRHLQSRTMRDYASGEAVFKTAASGIVNSIGNGKALLGGASITAGSFSDRLRAIQSLIGTEIPVAHVVGWATLLSTLAATIAITGWVEMVNTLDAM